jgi:hypothetical protein
MPAPRNRVKEKSRLLPQTSIDIMKRWYDEHYSNPYPTYRDCEMLAEAGNITVNQVKQWFVNVRRRSHNEFRRRRTTKQRNNSESLDDFLRNITNQESHKKDDSDESKLFDEYNALSKGLLQQEKQKIVQPTISYNINSDYASNTSYNDTYSALTNQCQNYFQYSSPQAVYNRYNNYASTPINNIVTQYEMPKYGSYGSFNSSQSNYSSPTSADATESPTFLDRNNFYQYSNYSNY